MKAVQALDLPGEKGFRAKEHQLRHNALRAAEALSVAVASLLLFMVMPLFPRELMAIVAVGLGALAYRAPTLAMALMIVLGMPGYLYQLGLALPEGTGLPVPMAAVMAALLLVIAVVLGEMRGALGIAAGTIAAVLLFTPAEYLALPLIIGTILVRAKHSQARVAGAILVFVILYFPVLAVNAGIAGGPPQILAHVSLDSAAPVPVLNIEDISARLSQVFDVPGETNPLPYLRSLAEYWPLSFEQRLLPVGVLFGLFAAAAALITVGTRALSRWLEKREVGRGMIMVASPTMSILLAMVAFVSLASLLARPLDYSSPANTAMMLIGGILVGGSASLVEMWLSKRDGILDLRARLADRTDSLREGAQFLANRSSTTKSLCSRMDTGAEDALLEMCEQELAFTEQAVADMPLNDLEQKLALFKELQDRLETALQDSGAKLYRYYDEDWQKYNDYLALARGYGISPGECIQGPDFSHLTSLEYDEVLKLQASLNQRYEASARSMAEAMERLEDRLATEVDPGFKRAGMDIARDYFARGRCADAIDEFLLELGDIECVLGSSVNGIESDIVPVMDSLKSILMDTLMPTAASLGDALSASYYLETANQIDGLRDLPGERARLPEFMRAAAVVRELGELIAGLTSKLAERLSCLEASIIEKAPRGYDWGADEAARKQSYEISEAITASTGLISIGERTSLIKRGPSVVSKAALAMKHYSVVQELLINYANIEYLLEAKLRENRAVSAADLPVGRKYAGQYLKLYRLKHQGDVHIEQDTGILTRKDQASLV